MVQTVLIKICQSNERTVVKSAMHWVSQVHKFEKNKPTTNYWQTEYFLYKTFFQGDHDIWVIRSHWLPWDIKNTQSSYWVFSISAFIFDFHAALGKITLSKITCS